MDVWWTLSILLLAFLEQAISQSALSYTSISKLTANDGISAGQREFGTSCALEGDYAVVGAGGCMDASCGSADGAGHAYVFEKSGQVTFNFSFSHIPTFSFICFTQLIG